MSGNYDHKLLEHVPEPANAPDMSTRAREVSRPAKARRRRVFGPKPRAEFLEALTDGWLVAHAARLVGFQRTRLYAIRKDDEDFRREWDEAVESGLEKLEDEVREAARDGWYESVYDGSGALLRRTHRKDPRLALRLRELRRPPDQTVDVRVGGGMPIAEEGRVATTLADVVAFSLSIGQAHLLGLSDAVVQQVRLEQVRRELTAGDVIDGDAIEEQP